MTRKVFHVEPTRAFALENARFLEKLFQNSVLKILTS